MVNFDVLGGVNFKKGCYPGQEIVARSQYRGTIKRRTALAHADSAARRQRSLSQQRSRPALRHGGQRGARAGGRVDRLVEIKLAAIDNGAVHVGSADGPALTFLALPYAFPADA